MDDALRLWLKFQIIQENNLKLFLNKEKTVCFNTQKR